MEASEQPIHDEPQPEPAKGGRARTSYVILRQTSAGDSSVQELEVAGANIEASSAKRAIAQLVGDDESANGETYVAVPERSWTQHTVVVRTKTLTELGFE